jgi:CHASE3 domain sensor protein
MSTLALDSNIISYLLKGDENIADRIEKETGEIEEIQEVYDSFFADDETD